MVCKILLKETVPSPGPIAQLYVSDFVHDIGIFLYFYFRESARTVGFFVCLFILMLQFLSKCQALTNLHTRKIKVLTSSCSVNHFWPFLVQSWASEWCGCSSPLYQSSHVNVIYCLFCPRINDNSLKDKASSQPDPLVVGSSFIYRPKENECNQNESAVILKSYTST